MNIKLKEFNFYYCLRYVFFIISFFIIFILSCKKERSNIPPEISFINDSGFVFSDTSVQLGTVIKIGIWANGSDNNITFLNVAVDDGTVRTALDSGLNTNNVLYKKNIVKSNAENETWIFTVMDRNRNKKSISLTLKKASTSIYGSIITYSNFTLGAQNNSSHGGFFSLNNGLRYFYQEAEQNKNIIDIIYYYDIYDATLSSPNESDAPAVFPGLADWIPKNETRYDTTNVTAQQFDQSNNDSLLFAVFNAIDGKRKGKDMQPGMVVSFSNHEGKVGLIKINSVSPGTNGFINITI